MEISIRKLVIGLGIVFLLGVMFAVVNGIYAVEEDQTLPLLVYAISFVSLLAGGFLVILFQWKINKIQLSRVMKVLPEQERKIISLLLENNNSLEQNKLVALTGIHRVKMSRMLTELEIRGVVKKTNLGNTNLVVLTI